MADPKQKTAEREKLRKERASKETEDNLDEALDETFPASDPPSMTQPQTPGAPNHKSVEDLAKRRR